MVRIPQHAVVVPDARPRHVATPLYNITSHRRYTGPAGIGADVAAAEDEAVDGVGGVVGIAAADGGFRETIVAAGGGVGGKGREEEFEISAEGAIGGVLLGSVAAEVPDQLGMSAMERRELIKKNQESSGNNGRQMRGSAGRNADEIGRRSH